MEEQKKLARIPDPLKRKMRNPIFLEVKAAQFLIKDKKMERKRIGGKRKRETVPKEKLLECLINRDQVGSPLDFLDLVKSYKIDQIGEGPKEYKEREAWTKDFDQEVKQIYRRALLGNKSSFEYLLKLLQDLGIRVRTFRKVCQQPSSDICIKEYNKLLAQETNKTLPRSPFDIQQRTIPPDITFLSAAKRGSPAAQEIRRALVGKYILPSQEEAFFNYVTNAYKNFGFPSDQARAWKNLDPCFQIQARTHPISIE